MATTPAPEIFLQLPDGPDRDALRAGLMAMHCIPVNLPGPGPALAEQLARLALDPQALVFHDISNALPKVTHRLQQILKTWPKALRTRTVLTRLSAGHVSLADRAWAQSLGFRDLMASFADLAPASNARLVLDWVAQTVGKSVPAREVIDRSLRAVPNAPQSASPRSLIRECTGLEAEALADLLQFKLTIRDRSYHLKNYPACFVGSEAVRWIGKHFRLERSQAIAIGQALQTLDLLYHVTHENAFADDHLFFRLRAPKQLPQLNTGLALMALRERLMVVDRSHLGENYPSCWIGQEAVNVLCEKRSITRHESALILHRLMQFGVFEHVVGEHGFVDGNFFYRFCDDPH